MDDIDDYSYGLVFFFQDDVIIRRISLVCFSLFFAATCWQRLAVIFHMYRVFPMMLAPKNKNAKVKKQRRLSRFLNPNETHCLSCC